MYLSPMATVSLTTLGVSPAMRPDANRGLSSTKNLHGSLQSVHEFTNSPRQYHVQKFVFPLALKSMKISEPSQKPDFFSNGSIFQTCNMSTSRFKVKTLGATDIENGEMSQASEIGVLVFILKNNKVLFGRRRTLSVAANTYSLPGGHLEHGESYEECATREVKEETGLDIKNIELLTTVNNLYYDAKHIKVTYMRAHLSDLNQTPQNLERDKCEGWEWYDLNNLPEPMFEPLREMLQDGFNPFSIAF